MARSLHSFGRTAKDIHFQEVPFASVGRTRRATLAAKQPHSERDRHSFDRLRRQWQAIHRKDKDVVLSRLGGGIVSKHKLVIEPAVMLGPTESNIEADIRIVGPICSAKLPYAYGVSFL